MNTQICSMEYDTKTNVVTLRNVKTKTVQMMIKLEACAAGTMDRLDPSEDADNYWIGVKPADSAVFNDVLMGKKQLIVKSIDFNLK